MKLEKLIESLEKLNMLEVKFFENQKSYKFRFKKSINYFKYDDFTEGSFMYEVLKDATEKIKKKEVTTDYLVEKVKELDHEPKA